MAFINILFPVYNEKLRLEKGIRQTISYMETNYQNEYVLTIVDNASTDETQEIAKSLCSDFNQIHYIRIDEKGVGAAIRAGVRNNEATIVGYMDVDLSTDLKHLKDTIEKFKSDETVDMVNSSRWRKESDTQGRKWYRNITSSGLTVLLRVLLKMKASDAICGFKFWRRDSVERLINEAGDTENGWFYIIELLLRAERNKMKIFELPVCWKDDYNSKVKVIPLINNYLKHIIRLRKVFKNQNTIN